MEYLFFFISFVTLFSGFLSFLIPGPMMFWSKDTYPKKIARRKAATFYFVIAFISFILFVIVLPKDNADPIQSTEVATKSPQPIEQKQSENKKVIEGINRNELIKKILAMNKAAHFEVGEDVEGETNYIGRDENNSVIQIIGPENRVSYATWMYFASDDNESNQLSMLRMAAFANIMSTNEAIKWVGDFIGEIVKDVSKDVEKDKVYGDTKLTISFSSTMRSITLVAKPLYSE